MFDLLNIRKLIECCAKKKKLKELNMKYKQSLQYVQKRINKNISFTSVVKTSICTLQHMTFTKNKYSS